MNLSILLQPAVPRIFLTTGCCVVPGVCFEPVTASVRCIPGRECGRLRDRLPGLSSLWRWFDPRVRGCRFRIRHRRLESRRGWPAREDRWARRFGSSAPPGGLSLRVNYLNYWCELLVWPVDPRTTRTASSCGRAGRRSTSGRRIRLRNCAGCGRASNWKSSACWRR